jgi:hypothetical protein
MPPAILTYLSIIAASFCIYSIGCFLFLKGNWVPFIRAISVANLLYSLLTIVLVIVHYPVITMPGIAYFVAEIIIVCTLVYIELRVANSIRHRK